ncbi:response regulator [Ramlibacter sp.]|uniref:response regulator n=1 Tax=Ramlibacter sp. TaxID=1917967 RepID=UPI0035B2118E
MRILLVEDESALATWLARALERAGILVDWVDNAAMALASLDAAVHDAVVLDLGLPDIDGQDLLRKLRDRDRRTPALVLTARDAVGEKVRAFHAGADDFLVKPFELAELEARLHALVRRAHGTAASRLACGALQHDPASRRFTLGGAPLALSPREAGVLKVLLEHAGEPLSKQQILDRVVADEKDVHPEAVEVIVHRLRKRLDGSGVRIETLRGLGYALAQA